MNPSDRYANASELLNAFTGLGKITAKLDSFSKVYRNTWLPPGFRTHSVWKMIVAFLFYAFWFIAIEGSIEGHDKSEWFGDIVIVLFVFIEAFFVLNYRDIHSKLPLTKSSDLKIKLIGIILYVLAIYIIMLLVYNIIPVIFGFA